MEQPYLKSPPICTKLLPLISFWIDNSIIFRWGCDRLSEIGDVVPIKYYFPEDRLATQTLIADMAWNAQTRIYTRILCNIIEYYAFHQAAEKK